MGALRTRLSQDFFEQSKVEFARIVYAHRRRYLRMRLAENGKSARNLGGITLGNPQSTGGWVNGDRNGSI